MEMDEVRMPEKRDRVVAEMHSERKLLAGLPEPQTLSSTEADRVICEVLQAVQKHVAIA